MILRVRMSDRIGDLAEESETCAGGCEHRVLFQGAARAILGKNVRPAFRRPAIPDELKNVRMIEALVRLDLIKERCFAFRVLEALEDVFPLVGAVSGANDVGVALTAFFEVSDVLPFRREITHRGLFYRAAIRRGSIHRITCGSGAGSGGPSA